MALETMCLAVHKNGKPLCVSGRSDATILTSIVGGAIGDDDAASFHVSGMCDLPEDRSAHLYWVEETRLKSGDRLRFELVRSDAPSTPLTVKAADSPVYLAEQAAFHEAARDWVAPSEPPAVRWPHLKFECAIDGGKPLAVRIPMGQEHILCSLAWNVWTPETCRVYVRTFSGSAQGIEPRETPWVRAKLIEGQALELCVSW
jgi:hypothetical protein